MLRKVCIVLLFFASCNLLPFTETTPFTEISYAASGVMVDDCVGDKKDEACKEDTKAAVDDNEESTAVGVSAWEYVKIIFALIFVVALLYGVLRFLNSRNMKYQHSKMMQNLGGISLGAQKSVQIVKIGNSLYLVGVGDNVNMLKEITDDNEKETLIALYNEKQVQPIQGTPILGLLKKLQKRQPVDHEIEDQDFKKHFADRLAKIKQQRNDELQQLNQEERDKKDE